ncbi:hypothetical protein [Actibacterium ureilyticum]|uniref:hypothetical protein n=1 Tax=Actibacterium ureilyticum TaxID=1590614 RepID=UPI000BAAEB8D|nr:hypothetical protein [Actibacterium ureilyticum]
MPILAAVIAIPGAAYFWMHRARNAAEMTQELGGMASDVMSAARRFGFRRRHDQHPVDSLEDSHVAIAGAALAFLEIGGLPTREQHDALNRSLQSHLGIPMKSAEEALILGRWLINECGGASAALTRLSKRLSKLDRNSFEPLMAVMKDVAAHAGGDLTDLQRDALAEIARVFRIG